MENLFSGNIPILYFIAVLYILMLDKLKINQKILIVYIFSYIIKIYGILDFKVLLFILNVDMFIYLEYLTSDLIKTEIVSNFMYRIVDYCYKMVFEYSFIYFILAIFIKTQFFMNCCNTVYNLLIINEEIVKYCIWFWNCSSILLLLTAITLLSVQIYLTNTFTYMKEKLEEIASWNTLKIDNNLREKLCMLSTIEDKSYFERENSYSFLSIEFLRYKLRKIKNAVSNFKVKTTLNPGLFKRIKRFIIYIMSKIKKLKNIKRYIRGYSTIEMQLIRTLGINKGYEKVFYRKIYEFIYSKIFFASYRKHCKVNKYSVSCTYKEYLMYCYIFIVKIRINGKSHKMIELWEEEKLENVSKEQFLISILGLSWRPINNDIIENYKLVIDYYNIDNKKLKKQIKRICQSRRRFLTYIS